MTSPDIGIQINTVQRPNLPYLDSDNRYLVRYRIRTSDGNLSTAWSTVHRITKPSVDLLTYTVEKEIKSHGKSFDVSWKLLPSVPEQIKDLPLDVYVKWDSEESWNFVTTTSTNSFSVPIPEAYQSTVTDPHTASFMVHLATFIKDRVSSNLDTLIFVESGISTRAVYDAGSIV